MPAAPRPDKKAMNIAYTILKTPKNEQQSVKSQPSKLVQEEWAKQLQRTRD